MLFISLTIKNEISVCLISVVEFWSVTLLLSHEILSSIPERKEKGEGREWGIRVV